MTATPRPLLHRPPVHGIRPLAAVTALVLAGVALLPVDAAFAAPTSASADYPTWSEVERARKSESKARAAIAEMEELLARLEREAAEAEREVEARAVVYEAAQQELDQAAFRASNLAEQAEDARTAAEESSRTTSRALSGMVRQPGSGDPLGLIADAGAADGYLYQLEMSSRLADRYNSLFEEAAIEANSARALEDASRVAESELDELTEAAEDAFEAAAVASDAAQAVVEENRVATQQLTAQLAVLKARRAATEADYKKGLAASAVDPSRPAGAVNGSGWAKPVSGTITSPYGPRPNKPLPGVNPFHGGVDLAASCGTTIYAATDGKVSYSGWLGTYGKWVQIDHGGGIQTGYAHNSKLLVDRGERVTAGQPIALVGTTGASTGCHSHVEVRRNGAGRDPVDYFKKKGVRLGR